MKKILIINTVPFGMGGMSSVIINYLNNMNKEDIEITLIVNSEIEKEYEKILKKNNINIIILKRNTNVIAYMYNVYKIMKSGKFNVVHIHGNSSTMAFETIPAYLNKIPKRIVHSHNTSCEHKMLNKILWPILKMTYTLAFACSEEAGKWLFKKDNNFTILHNAINSEEYKFDKKQRESIRRELGVDTSYVIGHVGYFNEQKNHEKLFQIVSCLKNEIDVKLLCISGDYEVPKEINDLINKYNLDNNIKILLRRSDVNNLLQAIDFFVFPSKFEGLGIALIEAQAAGLHCLASTNIPKEARICEGLVSYLELSENSKEWAKLILDIKKSIIKNRMENSNKAISELKQAGYDINIEAEKLREMYIK